MYFCSKCLFFNHASISRRFFFRLLSRSVGCLEGISNVSGAKWSCEQREFVFVKNEPNIISKSVPFKWILVDMCVYICAGHIRNPFYLYYKFWCAYAFVLEPNAERQYDPNTQHNLQSKLNTKRFWASDVQKKDETMPRRQTRINRFTDHGAINIDTCDWTC